jgi:hypothetical protein
MSTEREKIKSFIEEEGLYKRLNITLPENLGQFLPEVLHLDCCVGSKQPFRNAGSAAITDFGIKQVTVSFDIPGSGTHVRNEDLMPPGVYSLVYRCQGCGRHFFCLLLVEFKDNVVSRAAIIQKTGQIPAFDIRVPQTITDRISPDSALYYSRAQICLSHSYGIAACVYLRRMLADQINPLLEMNYEIKKEEGAAEKELKRFEEAISAKVFDEKIRLISQGLPESIEVPGNNPVLLAYRQLSNGLHNLTDQECVTVARRVSSILLRLLVGLREEQESKKRYLEDIRALSPKRAAIVE